LADAQVRLLAFCWMSNHIDAIVVPESGDSLAVLFRRVHGRYAQYLNVRRRRSGHLWQNRYSSCPLAETHLWTALRCVEQNPVRAGMVVRARDYEWSSAGAPLGLRTGIFPASC
jgi:putative transposase